jgi:uncharacterized protein
VRIVIDTNVLLSAFLWGGTPQRLIERVRANALELVISQALLTEFSHVIARPKFDAILTRTTRTPQHVVDQLQALCEVVIAPPLAQAVCRDPKDDIVLACALAGSAHLVASGDDDLPSSQSPGRSQDDLTPSGGPMQSSGIGGSLTLKTFEGIPIVTAAQAVAMAAV